MIHYYTEWFELTFQFHDIVQRKPVAVLVVLVVLVSKTATVEASSSCPAFAYSKDSCSTSKPGEASTLVVVESKNAELVLASGSLRATVTVVKAVTVVKEDSL